jgi:hypothetical protein
MNAYLTRTNNEFHELLQGNQLPFRQEHRRQWCAVVNGHTQREFEYKSSVFEQIVADTHGQYMQLTQAQQEIIYATTVKVCYLPRVFRTSGDIGTSFGVEESMGLIGKATRIGEQVRSQFVRQGMFVEDGPEGFWGWAYEGGRYVHWENAFHLDPTDPDSRQAATQYMMMASQAIVKESVGMNMLPSLFGPFADILGPFYGNPQNLMRQIKNTFDPQNLADSHFATSPQAQIPPEFATPPSGGDAGAAD